MSEYTRNHENGGSYLAADLLGAALAAALGGTMIEREASEKLTYSTPGDFMLPDGLQVCVGTSHRKKGFWCISTTIDWRERSKLSGHFAHVPFPEAFISASKPLDKIVKEVQRRVLGPSKEPLAAVKAQIAQLTADKASLAQHAADLRGKFPWLQVKVEEGKTEASLYANGNACYFNGRLTSSGTIYVDRVGSIDSNRAEMFLAALGPICQ
jgi:hypothetical protein